MGCNLYPAAAKNKAGRAGGGALLPEAADKPQPVRRESKRTISG